MSPSVGAPAPPRTGGRRAGAGKALAWPNRRVAGRMRFSGSLHQRRELRLARPDRAQPLREPRPGPRLDLAVARAGLTLRRVEILEPRIRFLDHQQLVRLAIAHGELTPCRFQKGRTAPGRNPLRARGEARRRGAARGAPLEVLACGLADRLRARVGDRALEGPPGDGNRAQRLSGDRAQAEAGADDAEQLDPAR